MPARSVDSPTRSIGGTVPESKKRKKNGKKVGNGHAGRIERLENMESGVTLQDLINIVAYQEAHPEEAANVQPEIVVGEVVADSIWENEEIKEQM